MMEEKKKFVEEIKDKYGKDLHMSRVPRHTRTWFLDYANDYHEGDYGACFKKIVDTFRGMTPVGYEEFEEQLNEQQAMINAQGNEIEQIKGLLLSKEPKEDVIVMANGKEKKRS